MTKNMFVVPYILGTIHISSSFLVRMGKRVISPGDLLIFFRDFDFQGSKSGNTKNDPKWLKIMSVALDISGSIHHMIVIFGTQV